MARPYSLDLRRRVVSRIEGGESRRSSAEHFEVSAATAVRWAQRLHESGDVAAKPMGGSKPRTLVGQRDWLLRRILEKPDLTLRAIQAELIERGVPATFGAVQRFFQREGITFKKKPTRKRTGST